MPPALLVSVAVDASSNSIPLAPPATVMVPLLVKARCRSGAAVAPAFSVAPAATVVVPVPLIVALFQVVAPVRASAPAPVMVPPERVNGVFTVVVVEVGSCQVA